MQAEASASHSDVMGPANWVGQAAEHLTFSPTHHSLGLTVFRTPGQKGEQLVRIVAPVVRGHSAVLTCFHACLLVGAPTCSLRRGPRILCTLAEISVFRAIAAAFCFSLCHNCEAAGLFTSLLQLPKR